MYDVIVLGATFAAAGIAQQHKEKCLVIERRAQAGYEFFGALDFTVEETEIYFRFLFLYSVGVTPFLARKSRLK